MAAHAPAIVPFSIPSHAGFGVNTNCGSVCTTNAVVESTMIAMTTMATTVAAVLLVGSSNSSQMRSRRLRTRRRRDSLKTGNAAPAAACA